MKSKAKDINKSIEDKLLVGIIQADKPGETGTVISPDLTPNI